MAVQAHVLNNNNADKPDIADKAKEDLTSLGGFFTKFNNDWSMMLAGSLAYSLLTAIVPILLAILSVLGFTLGPSTVSYVTHHLQVGNNPTLNQAVNVQLKFVLTQLNKQAGIIALIAIVTAIFGGSRLFIGLEGCLDLVYRVRPRKIIAQNVMAILMMILFIILVPIMIFAATLPSIIQSIIGSNAVVQQMPFINVITNNALTIWIVGFGGGLLAAFILFWAMYIIIPNQKIGLGRSWQGAIVSALALELFITIVFPFYTTRFMGNYAGQAGLVVILLVFFYYFAVILILGAEVNAYFIEKVRPLPNDLATFVGTMGGRLNKDIPDVEVPSHVDPKPTEKADQKHIAKAHAQEQKNQKKQVRNWSKIFPKRLAKDKTQKQSRQNKPLSKFQALLSVAIGSALAMFIELLRQRQQEH